MLNDPVTICLCCNETVKEKNLETHQWRLHPAWKAAGMPLKILPETQKPPFLVRGG